MSTYRKSGSRRKGRGWFGESHRHYLASKGIKTGRNKSFRRINRRNNRNLPPGFKYAVDEDKGVLSGVFNEAFDIEEEKNQKIESFQLGADNQATRAIDKLIDAPMKAAEKGANFELKSPVNKFEDDGEMVRADDGFDDEVDDDEFFSHHTPEARAKHMATKSEPWISDLPWTDDELEAIVNGNPPEMYVELYGDNVPREHRKQARLELERDDDIPGGLADGAEDDEFDPIQLQKGIMVEMVHTDDRGIAKELAKDNLASDPLYYEKIEEMGLA